MPLYEYRCADCGHEVEVLRKVSDPPPVECPSCKHPSLQKKLTAAGFQLKGTGWYVTDFRGGNRGAPAKPAGDEGAPAAPSSGEAAAAAAAGSVPTGSAPGPSAAPAAGATPAPAAPAASGSSGTAPTAG